MLAVVRTLLVRLGIRIRTIIVQYRLVESQHNYRLLRSAAGVCVNIDD